MNNPCYLEFVADKPERASKFYADVFGWKFNKADMPMDYWWIDVGSGPKPFPVMGIGMIRRMAAEQKNVVMYIKIQSIEEYEKKVEEHGGKLIDQRRAVPGYGWFHWFVDTEGNTVSLWQDDKAAK